MLHPSDEERLSAYFDEELSSDERAEVERLLREDTAASAWLEQVDDLHVELQSLPKFQLEADFADGVMRRAEREMLLNEPHARVRVAPAHLNGAATHGAAQPINTAQPISAAQPDPGAAQSPSQNLAVLGREVGEISRHADALPTQPTMATHATQATSSRTVVRPTIAGSRPWHAPAWLAAAASLLLFAGVLSLGTSERNWAKTASPGNQMLQAEQGRRSAISLAWRAEQTAAGDKTFMKRKDLAKRDLEKLSEMELDATAPAASDKSRPEGESGNRPEPQQSTLGMGVPANDRLAGSRPPETKGDGSTGALFGTVEGVVDLRTKESNGARGAAPAAPGSDQSGAGGVAELARSAGAGGAFGKPPPGIAAKSGSELKTKPAAHGAVEFSYFAMGPAAANDPDAAPANVVVVDVDGTPAEAFARVEQMLRREQGLADANRLANRTGQGLGASVLDRLTLQQAIAPPVEKRTTDRAKDDSQQRAEPDDASAARVYVVDFAPDELAGILRDVAVTERAKVTLTRLGLPQPGESLRDGEPAAPGSGRQAGRESFGAPSAGAKFEDRQEQADPIASDEATADFHRASDKKGGQTLAKKDLTPKVGPKNFDVAPAKAIDPRTANGSSSAPDSGPLRVAPTVPPTPARGRTPADIAADPKKGQFKAAEKPKQQAEGREDGAAPRTFSPAAPSMTSRFALPAGEAVKAPGTRVGPSKGPRKEPAPKVGYQELLPAADDAFEQPVAQSLGVAKSPVPAAALRAATIVVLRVNQPSRPVAPSAAPAQPAK